MTYYQEREATVLWRELKHVYPDLAPLDERTREEQQADAEKAKDELFGPEEKEDTPCLSLD